MAKRFTDSTIDDKAWFRKLPPRLKCAWEYLCRQCDVIGIWNLDMDKLSFDVGEPVTFDELGQAFKGKVLLFDGDKLFIPSFVAFQYGDACGRLSPKNAFHRSVAKKLKDRGLPEPEFKSLEEDTHPTPIGHPSDTPGGVPGGTQGRGRGKGSISSLEGGSGETSEPIPRIPPEELAACELAWSGTLKHFKIDRPILPHEQMKIATLIKSYGYKSTAFALAGMRFEVKTDGFDPSKNVAIHRAMDPKLFEKFINLASQKDAEMKKKAAGAA